jgi:PTS system nitrogen regulatory IIA component
MLTQEPVVFPYLSEKCVQMIQATSRDDALNQLVAPLKKLEIIPDETGFLSAILMREELVSTGIGLGCAIPHAKLSHLQEFFISIGVIKGPGIDWNSIDQVPVKLIFLIGGPTNEPNRYLKILSSLTEAIRLESFRAEILGAQTAKDICKLFECI